MAAAVSQSKRFVTTNLRPRSHNHTMSQRGPRISIFNSAPRPSGSKMSSWSADVFASLPRRRVIQACGAVVALMVVFGGLHQGRKWRSYTDGTVDIVPVSEGEVIGGMEGWGLHEEQGWSEASVPRLADLGEIAESRYRLGPSDADEYFNQLSEFAAGLPRVSRHLAWSIWNHQPENSRPEEPPKPKMGPPSMISYKTIHQTDKTKDRLTSETEEWVRINQKDGWKLNFLDDDDAFAWVDKVFPGTDIDWAWRYMDRGVLRADFLRYLLPMAEGGVYSDVDTRPIRPIEEWGRIDVEYLDISGTDGEDWRKKLATWPAVVVAIDVNVHAKMDWHRSWPRALGICQWTLSGAPYHPIFIDAVRRVVNSTKVVHEWDEDRRSKIAQLELEQPRGWADEVQKLQRQTHSEVMNVMEWTGPGLFSDAVMAFILARYRVTWHRLRGLDHPLRIGDVLILPITAFSPGGEGDFGSESPDSPQCNVLHNFRGSWKGDGA